MRLFGFILLIIVSLQQPVSGQETSKFLDLEDLICLRDTNFNLDSTKVILIVRNYRFKIPLNSSKIGLISSVKKQWVKNTVIGLGAEYYLLHIVIRLKNKCWIKLPDELKQEMTKVKSLKQNMKPTIPQNSRSYI